MICITSQFQRERSGATRFPVDTMAMVWTLHWLNSSVGNLYDVVCRILDVALLRGPQRCSSAKVKSRIWKICLSCLIRMVEVRIRHDQTSNLTLTPDQHLHNARYPGWGWDQNRPPYVRLLKHHGGRGAATMSCANHMPMWLILHACLLQVEEYVRHLDTEDKGGLSLEQFVMLVTEKHVTACFLPRLHNKLS